MTDRPREARRLRDVDHTHPDDDTAAGRLFSRGPTVIADGGSRDQEDEKPERLKDVDHVGPDEEGPNRVWERGGSEETPGEPPREAELQEE